MKKKKTESNVKSVLYVSRASLPPEDARRGVEILVQQARRRNETLEITGALAFTGVHFAQLLEGPPTSIDAVMESICRDDRHHSLRSFEEPEATRRRFPRWSLAYDGSATYVDRQIRPLFAIHHDDVAAARAELTELLLSLAGPSPT